MGKGTIVSNLGSGQYTVTLNRDRTRITRRLEAIEARLAQLADMIPSHEAARDEAKAEYNSEVSKLNGFIDEMRAHPTQIKLYQDQIEAQTKVVLEKSRTWQAWITGVSNAHLEYASLTTEHTKLSDSSLADPTVTAWCIDKTITLRPGDMVATAEIPYDAGLEAYHVCPCNNVTQQQAPTYISPATTPRLEKALVSADLADVRAEPGVSSSNPPTRQIAGGTEVAVLEKEGRTPADWYKLSSGEWIQGSDLQVSESSAVTKRTANVYARPGISPSNPPTRQIDSGTVVTTVARSDWYRIGDGEWVESVYLVLIGDEIETALTLISGLIECVLIPAPMKDPEALEFYTGINSLVSVEADLIADRTGLVESYSAMSDAIGADLDLMSERTMALDSSAYLCGIFGVDLIPVAAGEVLEGQNDEALFIYDAMTCQKKSRLVSVPADTAMIHDLISGQIKSRLVSLPTDKAAINDVIVCQVVQGAFKYGISDVAVMRGTFRGQTTRVEALVSDSAGIGVSAQCLKLDFSSWQGGLGCWVTTPAIDNPLAYNADIDWFACTSGNLDAVEEKAGGRPILLASDSHGSGGLIKDIGRYHDRVRAVVWDYECNLELDIILKVKEAANAQGLPLGISTYPGATAQSCINYAGFTYQDAYIYCDFALPQYYCQWWQNRPAPMMTMWTNINAVTTVPVIPIITTQTTTTKPEVVKYNPLSPATIAAVYYPMSIPRILVWNVKETLEDQWAALKLIPTT